MLTQIASPAERGKCTVPTSSYSFILLLLLAKSLFFPNQPHELISCFLFPSSLVTFSFREEYLAIASETKDNCVGLQVAD